MAKSKNNKTKFTDEELKKRMKNFAKFNSNRPKNKWLYTTDNFGKMEKSVVYYSETL